MKTIQEIIQGLKVCGCVEDPCGALEENYGCEGCPYAPPNNCCGDLMRDALAALEQQATWRDPIMDPPPYHKPVIVCRLSNEKKVIVEQGSRDLNGWWKVYGTRVKSVIAWRLLPEPPERSRS